MKKILLTTAATIIVGTVGVNYVVQGKSAESQDTESYTIEEKVLSEQTDNRHLDELSVLKEVVTLKGLAMDIVEDNDEKRVILLEDKKGIPLYKSIYTKDIERLKVVDFQNGLLYDNLLNDKEAVEQIEKQDHRQKDVQDMEEYKVVKKHIDLKSFSHQVVEDNKNKRVVIYTNKSGVEKYKSIYIKNKKHLKIIDFDQGLIYDEKINGQDDKHTSSKKNENTQEATPNSTDKKTKTTTKSETKKKTDSNKSKEKETSKANNSSISNNKEYGTLSNHIDMNKFNGTVVEDNKGKRITIFKDENGQKRYKSIYVKHKGFLKIIDLRGGMLFNGNI